MYSFFFSLGFLLLRGTHIVVVVVSVVGVVVVVGDGRGRGERGVAGAEK